MASQKYARSQSSGPMPGKARSRTWRGGDGEAAGGKEHTPTRRGVGGQRLLAELEHKARKQQKERKGEGAMTRRSTMQNPGRESEARTECVKWWESGKEKVRQNGGCRVRGSELG